MKKIAVIGSTMMDVVSYIDQLPQAGETREAKGFHVACGGKGANQAVAAAKLGAQVLMVAAVGDDLFGRRARENYREQQIDDRLVFTAQGVPNGVATILVDESSQNRILIYKGANEYLTPEFLLQAEPELRQCGLMILQLEIPLPTVYAAIDLAHRCQIPVLLNPAPAAPNLDLKQVCSCDFFMPNETELSLLTGMPTETLPEIEKAAAGLLAKGLKNIIVTIGAKGSLWLAAGEKELVPALKVKAVDSTGAGDAYIGCFSEHYVKTGRVLESMEQASRYAALSVTKKGTQDSYATAAEFAAFNGR